MEAEYLPWPELGYVTKKHLAQVLGRSSPRGVDSLIEQGLIPHPIAIGLSRVGWPVQEARQAVEELPTKVAARGEVRTPGRQLKVRGKESANGRRLKGGVK